LKVVLADDHRLMLRAVRMALEQSEDIELVGETTEGRKVLPLVASTQPDVVLLDFRMPDMDGLAVLDRLTERHPDVTVVMLSGTDDPALIDEALRRGARAFVVKQVDPRDLASAIRQAVSGTVVSAIGRTSAPDALETAGLTKKEREVLGLLARGLSNAEIGKELWLSQQTIKFHLTNVYRKLGVANRTEAARYALQHGVAGSYNGVES
jgi:DNA-binding NarL/FixJ family response regulator